MAYPEFYTQGVRGSSPSPPTRCVFSPSVLRMYLPRYQKHFLGRWVSRLLSYNPYSCVPFARSLPNHNHSILNGV